jgi:eukaryotic-like serine/threonine-protein kinase
MAAVPAGLAAALKDSYRLDRELGRGGMAIVYLALDLKHHRKVAVKVLRPELAALLGATRFTREIELAAQLQHPHILPLHDSGEVNGTFYYVMPYVEGSSLRDRLTSQKELPIEEAVRILHDVADALAAAHAQGVVHRDIKPENILLSGRHALVSDFGVAKALTGSADQHALTTAGVALGTPAYMAPEQGAADPHTDHRADLYAFGVTAYEVLTGRLPFSGATAQAVLVAHATQSPSPVAELRPSVPRPLADLVLRCLEKRPADRPQKADELLRVLETMSTPGGGTTPTGISPVSARRLARTWVAAAAVGGLVVVGWVAIRWPRHGPVEIGVSRLVPITSEPGVEWQPAISPDGKEVAYVAGRLGNHRLMVRSAVNATEGGGLVLAESGTMQAWIPTWSADGELVRFLACPGYEAPESGGCTWWEVGRMGGAARPLPPGPWRTAASPDGTQVAFALKDSLFSTILGTGESLLLAVHPEHPVGGLHSLAWAPDSRRLAYVAGNVQWLGSGNLLGSSIWVVDPTGHAQYRITDDPFLNVSPVWMDDRHLLFVSNRDGPRSVYLVEVGKNGARGKPRIVPGTSDAHSISYSIVARRLVVARLGLRQNIWAYPIGRPGPQSVKDGRPVTTGNQVIEEHDVSPDGHWLVYDDNLGGDANIYKIPVGGGTPVRLADQQGDDLGPQWSPDGAEVAFYGAKGELFTVGAAGGVPMRLTTGEGSGVVPAWSPSGLDLAILAGGMGLRKLRLVTRARPGAPWGKPVSVPGASCFRAAWLGTGAGADILCDVGNFEYTLVSRTGEVRWHRTLTAARQLQQSYSAAVSRDGAWIYSIAVSRDNGRRGIWEVSFATGASHLLVAEDDPVLSLLGAVSAGAGQIFATVSDFESDVWAIDLKQ